MAAAVKSILRPIELGSLTLANRVWMAPLTRCRATMPGHVPNALMAEMYAQRASAGLLIAEATMVGEKQSAFLSEPGVYSKAQIEGWKLVTEAVHAKKGKIFLQIVHPGRAQVPTNNGGAQGVAPAAVAIATPVGKYHNPSGADIPNAVPRALTDDEIPAIVASFIAAAKNGIEAGFDGIEVHGANGYLLNQFLAASVNTRTSGPYSGATLESRAKLIVDVVDGISHAIGGKRVGVRLSPLNQYNFARLSDPLEATEYLAKKFSHIGIGYMHLMRSDFFGPTKEDVVSAARANFKGVLVGNMGYSPEEAETAVSKGIVDAVAFGTSFLANPDLPARIEKGLPLNPPNPATFYGSGAAGYTDYPTA